MHSCFFIGHRQVPTEIQPLLCDEIERHITLFGVTEFYVGNYGAFDKMAAQSVIAAKKKHKNIELYLLLPYHPAERSVSLPDGFDGTYYPFTASVPHRLAIIKANQLMINSCDYLIAYAAYPGNAKNFWEYAQARISKGLLKATNLHIPYLPFGGNRL